MPDSDLVDYIQEQTQQGATAQNLRVVLMEAGWHESDINNALHDVAAGLSPATPGASIHEDLAQVRGMVAHLATRVHSIESTLASVGSLGMQEQLPSGTLGPGYEISAPKRPHWFGRTVMLLTLIGLFVFVGSYTTGLVTRQSGAPLEQLVIVAAVGALLLVSAIAAMRRRNTWAASQLTASAVTLWGVEVLISWRVYHFMEWTTAMALGVFLVVIAIVSGTWVHRYSKR